MHAVCSTHKAGDSIRQWKPIKWQQQKRRLPKPKTTLSEDIIQIDSYSDLNREVLLPDWYYKFAWKTFRTYGSGTETVNATYMCISSESIPRAILFNLMRFTFTSSLWFCRLILFAYRCVGRTEPACIVVRTVSAVDTRRAVKRTPLRQFSGVTCRIFVEWEILWRTRKTIGVILGKRYDNCMVIDSNLVLVLLK